MPRNISFALTTQQVRDRTKTVTRRMGWENLKQGEVLCAVVKSQGLKKGEKVERLAMIQVVGVRREFLDRMTADEGYGKEECRKEGFPPDPAAFVEKFCASHKGCRPDSFVTRIEFTYR